MVQNRKEHTHLGTHIFPSSYLEAGAGATGRELPKDAQQLVTDNLRSNSDNGPLVTYVLVGRSVLAHQGGVIRLNR